MKLLTSLFLALVMLFGFGDAKGNALSKQYQAGNWDGRRIGILHTAEVKDGVLYMNGMPSDYPADSSEGYYMPPVYSSEKGTWFADAFSAYSFDLVMRFDRRGENIRTVDFRHVIGDYAERAKVALTDDESHILVIVFRPDGKTDFYSFSVDPDLIPQTGEPYEKMESPPAYHVVAKNAAA